MALVIIYLKMIEIVQVVRKFGKKGGMERYVWELSHALADQGVLVKILCEEVTDTCNHHLIQINILKRVSEKPRWLAMLRFSRNVTNWFKDNRLNDCIIHSHERTSIHQVTTFHGPPFAYIRNKSLWKRISLRVKVWLYLEKRELCSGQVKVVLPNSSLIGKDLKCFYPCINDRLHSPAYPGIKDPNIETKKLEARPNTILFIGKEWKRKGLDFAVEIVDKLRLKDKSIELWVLGPDPDSVRHLFKKWKDGFKLLGWDEPKKYLANSKLLIHPAISEPYGMAISEATSFGVPVVISNNCGIANQVTSLSGSVLTLDDSLDMWVKACSQEIKRKETVKKIGNSWKQLALDHIKIYDSIKEL